MGISTTRTQRVTFKDIGAHTTSTVTSAVKALTKPTNAKLVMLQVETDEMRFTLDGTDPVAGSVGFILRETDPPYIVDMERITAFKYTRETTDALLQIQFGQGAG